jgi:hypothetical protein
LTAEEGVVQLMESCVEAAMGYQSVNDKAQISEYGVSGGNDCILPVAARCLHLSYWNLPATNTTSPSPELL